MIDYKFAGSVDRIHKTRISAVPEIVSIPWRSILGISEVMDFFMYECMD